MADPKAEPGPGAPKKSAAKRPKNQGQARPASSKKPQPQPPPVFGSAVPSVGEPPQDPSRADILQGMGQITERVKECFARLQVPGTIIVKLTILASGHVSTVEPTGELAGTPTAECVEEIARAVEFRPFKREQITLTYPIVFKAEPDETAAPSP